MTRFVTWDVDGKGGSSALYKSLPTPGKMVEIYSMAVDTRTTKSIQNQKMEEKKIDKRYIRCMNMYVYVLMCILYLSMFMYMKNS
jgi:hypothetical protein